MRVQTDATGLMTYLGQSDLVILTERVDDVLSYFQMVKLGCQRSCRLSPLMPPGLSWG